jgi:uroporphyrin-3 C-methyltransferase
MQASAGQDAPATAARVEPSAASASASPPARRGCGALAWIALLLVLVVAGGLGWAVWNQQGIDGRFAARLQALEASTGREVADLDELDRRWRQELQSAVAQMQADTAARGNETGQLTQKLEAMQAQLAEQRAELARYNANDRDAWSLAEAQYLLRLANQRLVMAGDVVAAQALMASADNILVGLDDVRLHDVRAAVAADLASVRALPRIDVEGIYLRLSALVEQAGELEIFKLPQQAAQPEQAPAGDWRGRLRQGYEAALAKLSNYIVIRRRDVPMQALMDPQWEDLVRQNLRMLLEQAQVASLSGNQALYRQSLQRAQQWLAEFFAADESRARAMSREITQLADMQVATSLPDLSRSVQALDAAMKQRLQQGGSE